MKFLFRFIFSVVFLTSTFWINSNIKKTLDKKSKTYHNDNNSYISNRVIGNRTRHKMELEVDSLPKYKGPGSNGSQVNINKTDIDYLISRNKSLQYAANNFISDMIGLKRIQKDMRPDKCKEIVYPSDLPSVSVIIILREEPIISLLRTAYSILETSPEHLIREIILVDDGSETPELVLAVKLHVANVEKLKLIRNEIPQGLMMARQKGIESALSEYFIVLDGHIEVTPGWLEPVIHRLVQEPKALLTSQIGVIDKETFEFYNLNNAGIDGDFMFFDQITLDELWVPYSEKFRNMRNGSVLPIEFGMVLGMMMAMRKDFFLQLGGFDPGMEVWGAEHTEMSVKVWLCGGRVEMIPCSKVAHLYRATPWHKFHPNRNYYHKNQVRFARVWMDGFLQELVLEVKNSSGVNIDNVGDVSQRQKIKSDNQCKPYQYYVDKIREISDVYIPSFVREKGAVRNLEMDLCLDLASLNGKLVLLAYSCHGYSNQFIILTEEFEIRVDRSWLTVEPGTTDLKLLKDEHTKRGAEFKWRYENKQIIHELSGKCLSIDISRTVYLEDCKSDSLLQKWTWSSLEKIK